MKFFPKNPREVLDIRAFYRIIKRFKVDGNAHSLIPTGTNPEGDASKEEIIERAKTYFDANPKSSVRQAARIPNLSYGCVPRIFKYLMIRYLNNEAFFDISLFLKKCYFLFFIQTVKVCTTS